MNLQDDEVQTLSEQLAEWRIQIAVLTEKQKAATMAANRFAQELNALRTKYCTASQQLKRQENTKTGSYMWENIGDGG